MKKLIIWGILVCFCKVEAGFLNSIGDAFESAGNAIKDTAVDAANAVAGTAITAGNAIKDTAETAVDAVSGAYGTVADGVNYGINVVEDVVDVIKDNTQGTTRRKENFCTDLPSQKEKTAEFAEIFEPSHLNDDKDPLTMLIKKHAPVVYLHRGENAMPMSGKDYFEHHRTQITHQWNHDDILKFKRGSKTILIPAEEVTSEKIYNLSKTHKPAPDDNIFAEIHPCITAGANPLDNTDNQGNLTTTAYVKTGIAANKKLYISYIFFYGFNWPYQAKLPFTPIAIAPGEVLNAHECDIEHIVEEFEKTNGEWALSRIFYSTHGSEEGMWLDANNPEKNYRSIPVIFEEGTHPVVYSAKGGHGCYPEEGTYVRIFGQANDITQKSIRWTPRWVRLFAPTDEEFNPKEQGWTQLPGDSGRRGVTSLGYKKWFRDDPAAELNDGNPDNRHFCGLGSSAGCVTEKSFKAGIPK
jgi:hypothetical protein